MFAMNRILVPVDMSDCSRAALRYALFLAERFEATIDVLHVWDSPENLRPPIAETAFQSPDQRKTAAHYLRTNAVAELESFVDSAKGISKVNVHVRFDTAGDAADAIVAIAREERFDAIVMGTHGRTRLARVLIGSVAEKVVRHAMCPTMTIRVPE